MPIKHLGYALLGGMLALGAGQSAAAAVTCTVTPRYSVLVDGESLTLAALCNGALSSIDWRMDGVSVSGATPLPGHVAGKPAYFTTPVGVGGTNSFAFTVSGVPVSAADTFGGSGTARVTVKPSSAVVAKATGVAAPTVPVAAGCGSANSGTVAAMPSGVAACSSGKSALQIAGPEAFTWSCLSLTGGAEASCYATRGGATAPTTPPPPPPVVASYTVATLAGVGGSISPASQSVTAGAKATVTASPASGYSVNSISGCGGTRSGNSFTTGSVIANCTVSASFATALTPITGACGSASNLTPVAAAPGANLCAAGSATSVASSATAYTWGCTGANGGGSTTACKSPRGYTVTTSAGSGGVISAGKLVAGGTTATFTVTPSAGYTATVTGCGGALSGGTYTTGAITASCAVSASFSAAAGATAAISGDPGIGAGLWVPPNMPNRTVADQSSSLMNMSYVPGCLNGGKTQDSSTGCATNSSYTGTIAGTTTSRTVTMGSGKQLVLRYKTPATIMDGKGIKVSAWNGGNVSVNMKIWLSTSPTASYDAVSTTCRAQETTTPSISTASKESITTTTTVWGTTSTTTRYYCQLAPNTLYYFGIEFPEAVSGLAARFQVDEMATGFLP
jgi:hypothetical protein